VAIQHANSLAEWSVIHPWASELSAGNKRPGLAAAAANPNPAVKKVRRSGVTAAPSLVDRMLSVDRFPRGRHFERGQFVPGSFDVRALGGLQEVDGLLVAVKARAAKDAGRGRPPAPKGRPLNIVILNLKHDKIDIGIASHFGR
jgi:hypothetical protein